MYDFVDSILSFLHFLRKAWVKVGQANDIRLRLIRGILSQEASYHDRCLVPLQQWHLVVHNDKLIDFLPILHLPLYQFECLSPIICHFSLDLILFEHALHCNLLDNVIIDEQDSFASCFN